MQQTQWIKGMLRSFRDIIGLLLLATCTLSAQVSERMEGTLLVQLFPGETPERVIGEISSAQNIAFTITESVSPRLNIWLFAFDEQATAAEKAKDAIMRNVRVANVQYNHFTSLRVYPNDPAFFEQWSLYNEGFGGGIADADIDADLAWERTTGGVTAEGDTIVIALIGEGQYYDHEDLVYFINHNEIPENLIDDDGNGYVDDYHGWNGTENTDSVPERLHGTHVAGIAGAKGNNGLGIAGVSWNVKLLPIYNLTNEDDAVAAYTYALEMRELYDATDGEKGAFIVATNTSFGIDFGDPEEFPIWCAMFDTLGKAGILNVGSTANMSVNIDNVYDMPTSCPSDFLVTVTNTDKADQLAIAGFGISSIDMGAPGTFIYSAITGGVSSYGNLSGTSMSAPHVTGTIALLFSAACTEFLATYHNDHEGALRMLKQYLLNGTDPIPALEGKTVSGGRLNANNALNQLLVTGYCGTGAGADAVGVAYPNPAHQYIFIAPDVMVDNTIEVRIVNAMQQLVFYQRIPKDTLLREGIPTNTFSNGFYCISVYNDASNIGYSSGIIIQHQ